MLVSEKENMENNTDAEMTVGHMRQNGHVSPVERKKCHFNTLVWLDTLFIRMLKYYQVK